MPSVEELQLDLLSWQPPMRLKKPRAKRIVSTRDLKKDMRIRVSGTRLRSADTGKVLEVREDLHPPMIQYRSDRNGGVYDVPADLVRVDLRSRSAASQAADNA